MQTTSHRITVTFLGTGTSQGVPVIGCRCEVCRSVAVKDKRLRTSALLHIDDKIILIDAGPDFRQQLLREKVTRLDAILLTHEHKDHIGGLDDVRALNYVNRKAVDIYAEKRVLQGVKSDFPYAFSENPYPGAPKMTLHEIDETPFDVFGIQVIPIRAMHWKLPVLGFRIGDVAYITDANYIAPSEIAKIHGCRILVVNALHGGASHPSHFTLAQALDVAEQSAADRVYLTHISHQMGLHGQVERKLPAKVRLAYDGLIIENDEL